MGGQGYQRFPLLKAVVGQTIAVHAAPANRTSTYLVSAFLIQSASFVSRTSPILNPRWATADAETKPPPPTPYPLVGAQRYQTFILSKSVVGQDIALHAAPADRASNFLVCAFLDSFNCISPQLLRNPTVEYVIKSGAEYHL